MPWDRGIGYLISNQENNVVTNIWYDLKTPWPHHTRQKWTAIIKSQISNSSRGLRKKRKVQGVSTKKNFLKSILDQIVLVLLYFPKDWLVLNPVNFTASHLDTYIQRYIHLYKERWKHSGPIREQSSMHPHSLQWWKVDQLGFHLSFFYRSASLDIGHRMRWG